jgi:hypothetical protein
VMGAASLITMTTVAFPSSLGNPAAWATLGWVVITVLLLSAAGGVPVAEFVGVEEVVVSGEHPANNNAPMSKKALNQREILFNIVNHLVK